MGDYYGRGGWVELTAAGWKELMEGEPPSDDEDWPLTDDERYPPDLSEGLPSGPLDVGRVPRDKAESDLAGQSDN